MAIEVSELRKSYGEVVAVRGVSFEVSAGEVFCLLGPNGAGKTTTVEMLEGYRARTAGDVRVLGMDPAGGQRELRERVGIVLQQTGVQGDLTVSELLEMYGRLPPRGARPGGPAMIRVLLAEDQAMVRGALASLLGLEPDIEVVAQVSRGDEVLSAARGVEPDIALLDIEMPGASGLDAAAALRRELPACRVLILTTFGRPGYLRRAMQSGASGFLLKDAPAPELAAAIRRAVAGERIVEPGLAAAALSEGESPLTPREREVLAAARDHPTVAELAAAIHLSPGTVRNHLSAAMQKLDARNRAEAARIAEEWGWL